MPTPHPFVSSAARMERNTGVQEVATKVFELTTDSCCCNFGAAKSAIRNTHLVYTWLKRDMVNYHVKVMKKDITKSNYNDSEGIITSNARQLLLQQQVK